MNVYIHREDNVILCGSQHTLDKESVETAEKNERKLKIFYSFHGGSQFKEKDSLDQYFLFLYKMAVPAVNLAANIR